MHIRKSFALVLLSACVVPQAQGFIDIFKHKDVKDQALTVDGLAFTHFVLPFADEQVDNLVPDTPIVGHFNGRHVAKAFVAASLTWARAKYLGANSDEAHVEFVRSLCGDLGYEGAKELLHQLGLDIQFSQASQKNFDRFAAPYLKLVLGVLISGLVHDHVPFFHGSKVKSS